MSAAATTTRDKECVARALVLIIGEWGGTVEEALAWLDNDADFARPDQDFLHDYGPDLEKARALLLRDSDA
jgi:hypothetical protein